MPMYWTFNCFLGCIYTVYYIVHIVFLVLSLLSNLEFQLPKKRTKLPKLGSRGGVGNSGNARKKTFFCNWPLPLIHQLLPTSNAVANAKCHWQCIATVCATISLFLKNSRCDAFQCLCLNRSAFNIANIAWQCLFVVFCIKRIRSKFESDILTRFAKTLSVLRDICRTQELSN